MLGAARARLHVAARLQNIAQSPTAGSHRTHRGAHCVDRRPLDAGLDGRFDRCDTFVGLPGLRSKTFTIDAAGQRALNFYVWNDYDAARAFFNDALVERVTGLYGVKPSVDFLEVAALVENAVSV